MKNNKISLISELLAINTKPINRLTLINRLLENTDLLTEVVKIAQHKDDILSGKAARAIEIVAVQNIRLVANYMEDIFIIAKNNKRDDVIRSLAKIIELLVINHVNKKKLIPLSIQQKENITNICFDWMLTHQKTAAQAHSMLALYHIGKEITWIHPELQLILEKNYASGSAGYKARAKKIMGLIKNGGKTTF